jgi:hypothetical protein
MCIINSIIKRNLERLRSKMRLIYKNCKTSKYLQLNGDESV